MFLNGQETLQITRSGSEVRYTAHGGSGTHRFNQSIICNQGLQIDGASINFAHLPTDPTSLAVGMLYRSGSDVKIKPPS